MPAKEKKSLTAEVAVDAKEEREDNAKIGNGHTRDAMGRVPASAAITLLGVFLADLRLNFINSSSRPPR